MSEYPDYQVGPYDDENYERWMKALAEWEEEDD